MLEHDVDTLLPGYLAGLVLETILAIVDDMICAERLDPLDLGIIADGGDHGAIDRLAHHDRDGSDTRPPGLYQHGFTGLQFRIVEQHVLHRREVDRCAGSVAFTA